MYSSFCLRMVLPDTKCRKEDSWSKASWPRLRMEAMVFSKILKNKLCICGCERGAAIFMWGIPLHLSWDMALSKASSAVNKQMFLRFHPVPRNMYFVLSAASAAMLRRQLKKERNKRDHKYFLASLSYCLLGFCSHEAEDYTIDTCISIQQIQYLA